MRPSQWPTWWRCEGIAHESRTPAKCAHCALCAVEHSRRSDLVSEGVCEFRTSWTACRET